MAEIVLACALFAIAVLAFIGMLVEIAQSGEPRRPRPKGSDLVVSVMVSLVFIVVLLWSGMVLF